MKKWKSAVENAPGNKLLFKTKFVDNIHSLEDDSIMDKEVNKLYRKLRSILPSNIKLHAVTTKQNSGDVGVDVIDDVAGLNVPITLDIDSVDAHYNSDYPMIFCPTNFSTQDLNDIVDILIDLGFNI